LEPIMPGEDIVSLVGSDERLDAARRAADEHAWDDAYRLLDELQAEGRLGPADLELLAEIAWFGGRPDRALEVREEAYSAYVGSGDPADAARVALRIAREYRTKLAGAVAQGWQARAERLLADEAEAPAHGHLALTHAQAEMQKGRIEEAIDLASRAVDIGTRFGDRDLQAYGLMTQGIAAAGAGHPEQGLALMDEATVAAVSGELSPYATGIVYCNTIGLCRDLADYRRAGEWTEAAKRWCERQAITGFPGVCRVHRAEILALQGAWAEAEKEARLASEELLSFNALSPASEGFYAVGEIRLRMGDLKGAEAAFRQALETGRNPQPGMALLQLLQGRVDAALTSIRSALADETWDRLARARLLPAQVEIALEAGDLATARTAAEELGQVAGNYRSDALHAMAHSCRGAVAVAEGDGADAIRELSLARRHWREIDVPYEAARVRMLMAEAYRLEGDRQAAMLEAEAARSAFERLGAGPDLTRAERTIGLLRTPTAAERLVRAFVFTDIVGSTELIGAIGDEAWKDLRRWHNETLRTLVRRNGGEEVNHAGDGFFLAFPDPRSAIDCAVAIQRALAEHRRSHGFSPRLRIGVHAAEAERSEDGYLGQGVHAAARIGALAPADEILVSRDTVPEGLRLPLASPRSVQLKGFPDPVEVVEVDWRQGA
jgi:class 3 adenylate cyclase